MHYDDDPEVANPHFLDPGNIPVVNSDDGIHGNDKRTLYGESLWYATYLYLHTSAPISHVTIHDT